MNHLHKCHESNSSDVTPMAVDTKRKRKPIIDIRDGCLTIKLVYNLKFPCFGMPQVAGTVCSACAWNWATRHQKQNSIAESLARLDGSGHVSGVFRSPGHTSYIVMFNVHACCCSGGGGGGGGPLSSKCWAMLLTKNQQKHHSHRNLPVKQIRIWWGIPCCLGLYPYPMTS